MINMTIIDFLKDRATRNADDLAFRFMGNGELDGPITEWTFAELYHQSVGVAEDLVELVSRVRAFCSLFRRGSTS